jgi:hypothetical protein
VIEHCPGLALKTQFSGEEGCFQSLQTSDSPWPTGLTCQFANSTAAGCCTGTADYSTAGVGAATRHASCRHVFPCCWLSLLLAEQASCVLLIDTVAGLKAVFLWFGFLSLMQLMFCAVASNVLWWHNKVAVRGTTCCDWHCCSCAYVVRCAYLSAIKASVCTDTHACGSHAAHTCPFSTALADLQVCTCVDSGPCSV